MSIFLPSSFTHVHLIFHVTHASQKIIGRLVTEYAGKSRVCADEPTIRRRLEYALYRVLIYVSVLFFRLSQRFLCFSRFGDILGSPLQTAYASLFIPDTIQVEQYPDDGSVLPVKPRLETLDYDVVPDALEQSFLVVLVYQ